MGSRDEGIGVLNQFLNYVMPGQTLLWGARTEVPPQYWYSQPLSGRRSREGVFFHELFFQSIADRVASLALRTLGDSLRLTDLSAVAKKLKASTRSLITFVEDERGTDAEVAPKHFRRSFGGRWSCGPASLVAPVQRGASITTPNAAEVG
jgi:hypothetical protein